MGDFRQGGRSGFSSHKGHGGGFGGRGGNRGGGDRGPVTMHKAVCDECKKPCEVPFRPTAGKPVYCNNCFGGKREAGGNSNFSNYKTPAKIDFGNDIKKVSGEEIKKQIEVLNVKIDNLVKVIQGLVVSKVTDVKAPEKTEKTSAKLVVKATAPKGKKVAKKVSKKK